MRVSSLMLAAAAVAIVLTCAYAGDDGSAPVSRPGKGAKPAAAESPKTKPAGQSSDEDGRVMEVVATGAGSTPDEAVQSAYSAAIEQVVGVLVDAETLVKNDQIVSDKIRTFSRGFVRSYDKVKLWDKDGIHYIRIRAKVAVDSLDEALKGSKVATREVPGELVARQIRFDVKNEAEAAEMLKTALEGFDMIKLTKVEIVGKPEITRDGASAKMQIKAKISPDMAEWLKVSKDLRPLLEKTATRRAADTMLENHLPYDLGKTLINQLSGQGVLVGVFTSANISGDKIQWKIFRVPEPMEGALKQKADEERKGYRVAFVLLTQDGKEIARTKEFVGKDWRPDSSFRTTGSYELGDIWWIGPEWFDVDEHHHPLLEISTEVQVSVDDLAKVAKVTATLEKVKGGN